MKTEGRGLECINCGGIILAVKDSRRSQNAVRRRRKCLGCGQLTTTYEMPTHTKSGRLRIIQAMRLFDKIDALPEAQRDALLSMVEAMSKASPPPPPPLELMEQPAAVAG